MRKTKTQELVEKAKEAGYREIEVIGANKALAEKGDQVVRLRINKAGQLEES